VRPLIAPAELDRILMPLLLALEDPPSLRTLPFPYGAQLPTPAPRDSAEDESDAATQSSVAPSRSAAEGSEASSTQAGGSYAAPYSDMSTLLRAHLLLQWKLQMAQAQQPGGSAAVVESAAPGRYWALQPLTCSCQRHRCADINVFLGILSRLVCFFSYGTADGTAQVREFRVSTDSMYETYYHDACSAIANPL
jgi:hypothetical protein